MTSDRTELYIDAHGPDEEAATEAFQWLLALADERGEKQDTVIAVNTKSPLDGVISSVIGDDVTSRLKDAKKVDLDDVQLYLVTKRIDVSSWSGGPALVFYPDKDLLDKIDEMRQVTDVLVVPWNRDEIQFWIDQWGASELGGDTSGDPPEITDPVVEEALDSLDALVNMSSGLTHRSDRSKAIELFKILKQNGHQFDPETIRSWLVREKGWEPSQADDVQEVAKKVLAGKRLQYDDGNWANDILEQWRESADAT